MFLQSPTAELKRCPVKLSVSVDDALYHAACVAARPALGEEARGSRLVQHALSALLQGSREPAYAAPVKDEALAEVMEQNAARLRLEAQRSYELGWRAGMEEAIRMPWRDLETLALLSWDYDRFADWQVERLREEHEGRDSEELEDVAQWRDHAQRDAGTAHRAGRVAALRQLHAEVVKKHSVDTA